MMIERARRGEFHMDMEFGPDRGLLDSSIAPPLPAPVRGPGDGGLGVAGTRRKASKGIGGRPGGLPVLRLRESPDLDI